MFTFLFFVTTLIFLYVAILAILEFQSSIHILVMGTLIALMLLYPSFGLGTIIVIYYNVFKSLMKKAQRTTDLVNKLFELAYPFLQLSDELFFDIPHSVSKLFIHRNISETTKKEMDSLYLEELKELKKFNKKYSVLDEETYKSKIKVFLEISAEKEKH